MNTTFSTTGLALTTGSTRRVFSLFRNLIRYAATPSSPGLTVWEVPPHKRNGMENSCVPRADSGNCDARRWAGP